MPLSRAELDARLDGLDKAELLAVIVDAASRLERIAVDPVGACGVPSDSTAAPLSQTGTVNGYQNQATDEALVSPSASLETTCAEQHIEQVQHLEESPGRADVAQQLASHFQADIASHSLTLINPARLKARWTQENSIIGPAIPCAYCSAQPRSFSVHLCRFVCHTKDETGTPWSCGEQLGQCRFGTVHRAVYAIDLDSERKTQGASAWQHVAVKARLVPRSRRAQFEELAEEFLGEVATVATLSHHNVLAFVGAAFDGGLLQVTELCARGSLAALLDGNGDPLQWYAGLRESVIHDIANGMAYLHGENLGGNNELLQPPLVHQQLRPVNVLLTDGFRAKLTGIGTKVAGVRDKADSSARWTAPETFMAQCSTDDSTSGAFKATTKLDVWAFGMTLYNVESGHAPWSASSATGQPLPPHEIILRLTRDQDRPVFPERNAGGLPVDTAVVRLAQKCWAVATSRPSFSDLLQMMLTANEQPHRARYWDVAGFKVPLPPTEPVPLKRLPNTRTLRSASTLLTAKNLLPGPDEMEATKASSTRPRQRNDSPPPVPSKMLKKSTGPPPLPASMIAHQ